MATRLYTVLDNIVNRVLKIGAGSLDTTAQTLIPAVNEINTTKQAKSLSQTIAGETTVEGALDALNSDKQPKTMSQTIGGETTVEGCLSSLNSNSWTIGSATDTNFNNFKIQSILWVNNISGGYSNAPATSAFHVMTISPITSYKVQLAFRYTGDGMYFRARTDSAWSSWKSVSLS